MPYYRGYYVIRDQSEWAEKGRIEPIKRLPPNMVSSDPVENFYRLHRRKSRSRSRYLFHPFISDLYYPPKKGVRMEWGIFE